MDFQIGCVCCNDKPLIVVKNASLAAWQEAIANGQIKNLTCTGCGCCYDPCDDGDCISQEDISCPKIVSIDVATGPAAGGTAVTLAGHAFDIGTLVVKFGGVAATNIRNNQSDSVTVDTPAHAAGVVDVTVENEFGQRAAGGKLVGAFTYT